MQTAVFCCYGNKNFSNVSRWQIGSYNRTRICRFSFQALHRLDVEQVCLFFPWLVVWKCKWRHVPLITSFMQRLNEVPSESTVLALKCSTWLKTFKVSLNWDLREKSRLKKNNQTKTIIIIKKHRLLTGISYFSVRECSAASGSRLLLFWCWLFISDHNIYGVTQH